MSFSIEGWMEIARGETAAPHSWEAVIRLAPLIDVAGSVAERLFGLSKRVVSGELAIAPLAANRGVPGNVSEQVRRDLDAISEHERQYGKREFGGFTWARWSEVRRALSNEAIASSECDVAFALVQRIAERRQITDEQIRLIVWFNW